MISSTNGVTTNDEASASADDSSDDEAPELLVLDSTPYDTTRPSVKQAKVGKINNDNIEQQDEQLLPCPVTILSGFLGSGKTTLIQYILQSPNHGYRIAIIENEFGGDSGTDNSGLSVESLIATDGSNKNKNLVDLMELPNGCVCCTVKDSLVTTLEVLLQKRQDLDYIIIECSGMANPGPIATLFWLDDALGSRIRLDGIVTLVDALHIERQLQSTVEASQQVAYADRILLNKVDLINTNRNNDNNDAKPSNEKIDRLKQLLEGVNPTAPIRLTSYSQVPDLDWILNARCFDSQRTRDIEQMCQLILSPTDSDNNEAKNQQHDHHQHEGPCTDSCSHHHHHHRSNEVKCDNTHVSLAHFHTAAVSTISLYQQGSSINLRKLNQWLATILWPQQDAQNSLLTELISIKDAKEANGNAVSNSKPKNSVSAFAHDQSGAGQHSDAMEIFRMKGILSVIVDRDDLSSDNAESSDNDANPIQVDGLGQDPRRYILQAVHDLWEVYPSKDSVWGTDNQDRSCKIIVIGRSLDREELQKGFIQCFD